MSRHNLSLGLGLFRSRDGPRTQVFLNVNLNSLGSSFRPHTVNFMVEASFTSRFDPDTLMSYIWALAVHCSVEDQEMLLAF